MKEKLLVSYSFLAALSENDSDIYKTVFLPLFKRSLYLFSKKNNKGKDVDIQEIVDKEFGISVPILIVRKLIKAVAKDLSRKEKSTSNFKVFEDGMSFQFDSFEFNHLEEIYEREKRNANSLQKVFEDYVKIENGINDKIPSLACFIYKNKQKLSSFFCKKIFNTDVFKDEGSFMPHVSFLQYIENNSHQLYKTAEQIYLGSIIASYLESGLELDTKIKSGIIYYLDTQIILEALDLQKIEDTQPTLELLKLISETGGKVKVLNTTICEIQKVLESTINNYSKVNPTTTVNEACLRIGKNKTWLINISGRFEDYVKKELQIDVDYISEKKIVEYLRTEDITLLKKTRVRKGNAAHDVIAYLHVKENRKESVRFFQKAKYWFVTANKRLCDFNLSRKMNNAIVKETIMPEELTSLLFLKNPNSYSKRVSKIGLNELIAQTLSEEYANKEIINEFDNAIKSNINLNSEDYEILLSSVAVQSTTKIQNLLEDIEDKRKFNEEVHKLIDIERSKRIQINREKNEFIVREKNIEQEKNELKKKIEKIENDLIRESEERKNQDTKLELFKKEREEDLAKRRKNYKWIIVFVLALLIWKIVYWFPSISDWLSISIKGIASLGGLWAFITLIIEFIKRKD